MTTPQETPKRLQRSRTERMVAGVCGGVGEYFSIDANLVRLVIAVLVFAGGAGAFLYAVGWLILPEEGDDASVAQRLTQRVQQR